MASFKRVGRRIRVVQCPPKLLPFDSFGVKSLSSKICNTIFKIVSLESWSCFIYFITWLNTQFKGLPFLNLWSRVPYKKNQVNKSWKCVNLISVGIFKLGLCIFEFFRTTTSKKYRYVIWWSPVVLKQSKEKKCKFHLHKLRSGPSMTRWVFTR